MRSSSPGSGGSLSCSLVPWLSLASSPNLDTCGQSPHSLRGLNACWEAWHPGATAGPAWKDPQGA